MMRRDHPYKRLFKPRVYLTTFENLYHQMRVVRRLSFPQMAKRFGCDPSTVFHACRRLGVPVGRPLIEPTEPLK